MSILEGCRELLTFLEDPNHVWRFQSFLGVKKVKVVGNRRNGRPWVALESSNQTITHLPERVKIPTPPIITETSFERDHRVNLQVRAIRKKSPYDEDDCSSLGSSGYSSETEAEEEANIIYYEIGNQLLNLVYMIGTGLGDESLVGPLFAITILNWDSVIGRQMMMVYTLLMYIGQSLKDTIRWDRPSMPPVIQMERKWALEYGMPSTHSMVGLGVPATMMYLGYLRHDFSPCTAVATSILWWLLVSSSRIYLGMHSFADVIVGLLLSLILLPVVLTIVGMADMMLVTWVSSPVWAFSLSLMAVCLYPGSHRWTPARGETTAILGVNLGVHMGFWALYQTGYLNFGASLEGIEGSPDAEPFLIVVVLRMIVGSLFGLGSKKGAKTLALSIGNRLLFGQTVFVDDQVNSKVTHRKRLVLELATKFISYLAFGFNIIFLTSVVLPIVGLQRSSFYTEF